MSTSILAMWMPGPFEWAMIVGVALVVFGRRLPDVARSVGKSIVEFKRGMRDVKDDMETQSRIESSRPSELPDDGAKTEDSATPSSESSPKSSTPSSESSPKSSTPS